jgi:hypothetical protein
MEQVSGTPTPGNQFPVNHLDPNADPALDSSLAVEEVGTTEGEAPAVSAEEVAAQEDARNTGWVDKEEWERQGRDVSRWRPATEYLEVRERIKAVNHEELQKRDAKIAALEAKLNAREQREAADRAQLTRETLRMELKQAREADDWDRVDEITDKMLDLKVSTAAAPKAPAIDPHVQETFQTFAAGNKWLTTDKKLAANFAIELKGVVDANAAPDMTTAMEIAKDRVMRLYPEKFRSNGSRPRTSMTEMGGTSGGGTNGKTWADLTPNYRQQAERDIAAKKYTKEVFLANCVGDPDAFRR